LKIIITKKIFHSKVLALSLIFSFLLLTTIEVKPNKVESDSNKEFKPVVRAKEAGEEIPAAQKDRFERLLEEGKKLFQEEMDPKAALKKFKEAQNLAITRSQKADVYFYLSLIYYATLGGEAEELAESIRKLIEVDYYRELDKRLCPPGYRGLFQEIKKEYGVLKVQSKPAGADVYLNNSKVPAGKTPLTIGSKAGSVKIRVKKGRKKKKEILRVIAGKETASPILILKGGSSLLLVLGGLVLAGGGAAALLAGKKGNGGGNGAPVTGNIQVNSTPTGAQVFLDGNNTGQATNCTLTDVSPGSHTVKLVMGGYEDEQMSVSVTAGLTATVSVTLTKPTITVIELPPDTVWTTGEEVEIKWQTSGSGSSQGVASTGTGLNPLINQGRRALSRFQRRGFQERRFLQSGLKERRETEGVDSSGNRGELSSNKSKPQGVSGEISFSVKEGYIVHKRAKDTGNIKRKGNVAKMNIPVAPRISTEKFIQSGYIRVLGLSWVKIDLYKGSSKVMTIVESTYNDGSYLWTVAPSLEDGTDYKVRVSGRDDSTVYGESDEFRIITQSYEFVTKWGSNGVGDGQFDEPYGVAIDSSGYVYVGDHKNNRIQKFTSNGGYETKWGSYGSGNVQFIHPVGTAVDNSGYVYVADEENHRIQKFTSDGSYVTKWGRYGSGNGEFKEPWGLVADMSVYIYVTDRLNHRIQKFTSDGTYVTQWGSQGSGNGQFDNPHGIAVDEAGYVYVVDTHNYRIQKFTSSGDFVTKWGSQGSGDGQLSYSEGIAVDNSGYVYVTDTYNHRIQKFTSNGDFITKWASEGSGDGQFKMPTGIAVDSSGYIYVADTENHCIQKFQPISIGLGLIGVNSTILNNNIVIDKNSTTKSYDIKSPLQNRLKKQKNQINRDARKSENQTKKKDRKNEEK